MISDRIKKGNERAPHRSLLFACGMKRSDMDKPFIGICNSYESFVPGHCHLNKVGEWIKECVIEAGGVPLDFFCCPLQPESRTNTPLKKSKVP